MSELFNIADAAEFFRVKITFKYPDFALQTALGMLYLSHKYISWKAQFTKIRRQTTHPGTTIINDTRKRLPVTPMHKQGT